MTVDNPFDEPDDSDRTVIRPAPGGRRPVAQAAPITEPAQAAPAAPVAVAEGAESLSFGRTPLLAAAAPLLQLLARLGRAPTQPDPAELRARTVGELRSFEAAARDAGVASDILRPAHYALCASLDDVVLNAPWGSQSIWDTRSLVSTFHQEVRSGERFFDLLAQFKQSPGTLLPVLELMYLCLALGFQGRYRLSPRGPAELDRLREDLYALIARQRPAVEPGLSPHWQGVSAPYRPRRAALPIWVAAVAGLAAAGGLFLWFSTGVNTSGDDLFARLQLVPLGHMPAIARAAPVQPPVVPPPTAPGPLARLRGFLKPEIEQGLVAVLGDDTNPIVRIRGTGMFAPGSATLQPAFMPLLDRIGAALKAESGAVLVIGHTDNQPIRTVQFPSNFALSTARARAAGTALARTVGEPARISAEGRADAEPIAANATPEGRAENRRIEIMLRRRG